MMVYAIDVVAELLGAVEGDGKVAPAASAFASCQESFLPALTPVFSLHCLGFMILLIMTCFVSARNLSLSASWGPHGTSDTVSREPTYSSISLDTMA